MTRKLNNFELYEIDGKTYSLEEIKGFIEASKKLERQTRFNKALKLNNSKITLERNALIEELNKIKSMGMFEFADKYCNDNELEEAGHAFARSLGVGVKMTPSDIAEEEFISAGEAEYERTWNLAYGDDF